jgi:hypothetical protein
VKIGGMLFIAMAYDTSNLHCGWRFAPGLPVVRERLAKAGLRLAWVLNQALGEQPALRPAAS